MKEKIEKLTYMQQVVFENACDCLWCGYGFATLNYYDLSKEEALDIWRLAIEYLTTD